MSTVYPSPGLATDYGHHGQRVPVAPSGRTANVPVGPVSRFPALSQLSLPGAFSGTLTPTLNNFIATLAACGLWLITLRTEVGGEYEAFAKRQIFGVVTVHVAITLAVLLLYVAVDLGYLSRLFTKTTALVGTLGVIYVAVIGLVRQGNTLLFREELYLIRWFAVGFMLMRVVITQKGLRLFLAVASIGTAVLLFFIMDKATTETLSDTSIRRVVTSNMWPVVYCSFIVIGLMLNALWPLGTIWQMIGLSAYAVTVVTGSVRTSTRSLFGVQAVLLLLTLLALARDPRLATRRKWLNRLKIFAVAIVVLYLGRLVISGRIFTSISLISRRFLGEEGTGLMRVVELQDMLAEFGPVDWLFGGGLGSFFVTTLGWWAARPHITYFTWLQKGGLAIMVLATLMVYIGPALRFARAVMTKPRADRAADKRLPSPILVVGPSLMAWCSTTFVSGGFDNGSMLALGGLCALWMELEDEVRAIALAARYQPMGT